MPGRTSINVVLTPELQPPCVYAYTLTVPPVTSSLDRLSDGVVVSCTRPFGSVHTYLSTSFNGVAVSSIIVPAHTGLLLRSCGVDGVAWIEIGWLIGTDRQPSFSITSVYVPDCQTCADSRRATRSVEL